MLRKGMEICVHHAGELELDSENDQNCFHEH